MPSECPVSAPECTRAKSQFVLPSKTHYPQALLAKTLVLLSKRPYTRILVVENHDPPDGADIPLVYTEVGANLVHKHPTLRASIQLHVIYIYIYTQCIFAVCCFAPSAINFEAAVNANCAVPMQVIFLPEQRMCHDIVHLGLQYPGSAACIWLAHVDSSFAVDPSAAS